MKLIDADKLLDDFIGLTPYGMGQVGIKFVDDLIKSQPTAYDVDKVVGELILESIHQSNNASIIGTKDAIDIVKRGGVEDE